MKCILIFAAAWIICLNCPAATTQSIHISFDKNDYSIKSFESGDRVISGNINDDYLSNSPSIPWRHVLVATDCTGPYDISYNCGLPMIYCTDFKYNRVPLDTIHGAGESEPINSEDFLTVNSPSYSQTQCEFIGADMLNGYSIIHLKVSPFLYNENTHVLEWNEDMTITIASKGNKIEYDSFISKTDQEHKEFLKSKVVNPEILDEVCYPEGLTTLLNYKEPEYIIVTSSDLESAFRRLAEWKTAKGVPSKIVTTDEINNLYEEGDLPLKIKKYLSSCYDKGLVYVLLGGDDSKVPPRYCSIRFNSQDRDIPVDSYYSCFGKDINWDRNGNYQYGEIADSVNLVPSLYVTRLPVRTQDHVISYISKLISYESDPVVNNTLLMGGWKISQYSEGGITDAEIKGDIIYERTIAPQWNGKRDKLYTANGPDFSSAWIRQYISNGYSFIHFDTHGLPQSWTTRGGSKFDVSRVLNLKNKGHSVITTSACYTNGFDTFTAPEDGSKDPCLSEAFIRNPDSGVVAYIGGSREGFVAYGNIEDISYSFSINESFYERLFTPSFSSKNFGRLIAEIKLQNSALIDDAMYKWRWVLFNLNPIGDPEMCIYEYA